MRCSIKNIIRRNLYHSSTMGLSSTCQYSRSFLIQFAAQFFIIFRFVNCCVSSTIHYNINLILCNASLYSLFVTDIQLLYISKKNKCVADSLLQELASRCQVVRWLRLLILSCFIYYLQFTIFESYSGYSSSFNSPFLSFS